MPATIKPSKNSDEAFSFGGQPRHRFETDGFSNFKTRSAGFLLGLAVSFEPMATLRWRLQDHHRVPKRKEPAPFRLGGLVAGWPPFPAADLSRALSGQGR